MRQRPYLSSTSQTEDYDEMDGNVGGPGENVFKFPPLKPAQRVIEQSPDMDADQEEESDTGIIHKSGSHSAYNPALSFKASSGPFQGSLELTSSSGEASAKDDQPKSRYLRKSEGNSKKEKVASESTEMKKETAGQDSELSSPRKRSPRRQLFEEHKHAEDADNESGKDSSEENLMESGDERHDSEEKQDESGSFKEEDLDAFEVGMSYDSAVNGAGSTTSHEEADEQGLMRLCVSKYFPH